MSNKEKTWEEYYDDVSYMSGHEMVDMAKLVDTQAERIAELEAKRDEYKNNLLEYINECGADLLKQNDTWMDCQICGDVRPDVRNVDDYDVCTNCCPEGCTPNYKVTS